jgi:hypothetical protein
VSPGCANELLTARSYMETKIVGNKGGKVQAYPISVDTSLLCCILHQS